MIVAYGQTLSKRLTDEEWLSHHLKRTTGAYWNRINVKSHDRCLRSGASKAIVYPISFCGSGKRETSVENNAE